jgi:hypothetical protein
VLVTRHHGGPPRPHHHGYVDLRLRSVLELPRARARLRG